MIKVHFKSGEKKNRLTLIKEVEQIGYIRYGLFKCDCGIECTRRLICWSHEITKSCGCLNLEVQRESLANRNRTHNLSGNNSETRKFYHLYVSIKNRCYDVDKPNFHNYGGRGIKMCDEWLNNIFAFIEWCKVNGYKKGLQLDRINNDGNYTPDNCRFITHKENQNNKRTNKVFYIQGERYTVTQISEKYKLHIDDYQGVENYGGGTDNLFFMDMPGSLLLDNCNIKSGRWPTYTQNMIKAFGPGGQWLFA